MDNIVFSNPPAPVLRYVESNFPRFVEQLKAFLKIPSVSADKAYRPQVQQAAAFLAEELKHTGWEAVTLHEKGSAPPILTAEKKVSKAKNPNQTTVLLYGHYDVQPPDPLELWKTPPFHPELRGGRLYARGASDDKGQLYLHLKAFEAYLATNTLPVNVKLLIEGEEETGSASLYGFVKKHRRLLRSDLVLISDSSMFDADTPALVVSTRGLLAMELIIKGPKRDLHSGTYGGVALNPLNLLVSALATFTGPPHQKRYVRLPHFYEAVAPLKAQEKKQLAQLPFPLAAMKRSLGVKRLKGEQRGEQENHSKTALAAALYEQRGALPTFDLNGLSGGYQGEGAKTIIPSEARAKLSFRLVPHQTPKQVVQQVKQQLAAVVPAGASFSLNTLGQGEPFLAQQSFYGFQVAAKALQRVFRKKPVFLREGGSIPIVKVLKQQLENEVILMGFGQDEDNIHAPNESFKLKDFKRGLLASVHFLCELSAASSTSTTA